MHPDFLSPALLLALTTYTVGVASPGPSNMAIMATAMSQGRSHALALAGGVICGSVVWGLLAALGMSAVMRSYSWSLLVLKLFGGLYMLWLAWKAARSALSPHELSPQEQVGAASHLQSYTRGLGLHLTNPKAIFVWLSIVALALPPEAERSQALAVVAACAAIGAAVFSGYALAFSTPCARSIYMRIHRWFNAGLSIVFAHAGIRLLFR